ncbi:MAG: thiamine phosphate synthase [Propionibacteriaceae bacterium]|jgi:thiamine-phosphate pyrophosphorylase|nr:thiamine phosphate synthase [Propionibacteriaceae bacterium]
MKPAEIQAAMELYAVTDSGFTGRQTLLEQIEDALKGGVTCVQVREKELEPDSFLEEAIAAKKLCRSYGVPLIVNDNVEVAIASGADGVHIGQSDMPAAQVRKLIGERVLGVSASTVEQALKAQADGADYLGVGAVFPTDTKLDADSTPPEVLREITQAVDIPVVAIGGISRANIGQLRGTGIAGVALVSAIFGADDIESECRELLKLAKNLGIEGAIFDLDGTLLDTMGAWRSLASSYIRSKGLEPKADLDEAIGSMTLEGAVEFMIAEYRLDQTKEQTVAEINASIDHVYERDCQAKTGAAQLLAKLRSEGVKLSVATLSTRPHVDAALSRLGLDGYFEHIVIADEVGLSKDDPAIFARACELLGTDKALTLAFDDAAYALAAARAAGLKTVGVFEPCASNPEQVKQHADLYVSSLEELL